MDIEEDSSSKGSDPPQPSHCDSPLTDYRQRWALGLELKTQKKLKRNYHKQDWELFINLGAFKPKELNFSRVIKYLMNDFDPIHYTINQNEFNQQFNISKEFWDLNINVLNHMGINLDQLLNLKIDPPHLSHLYKLFHLKRFFQEGVATSGTDKKVEKIFYFTQKSNRIYEYKDQKGLHIIISQNICYIRLDNNSYLGSRDHFLVLSDIAAQRYNIFLTLYLQSSLKLKNGPIIDPTFLKKVLLNGDNILEIGSNEAYSIIYGLESLCISCISGNLPVGSPNGISFFKTIYNEQFKKAKELNVINLFQERVDLIVSISSNIKTLIEIYGLYRIWGHPTVDPIEGTIELQKHSTQSKFLHPDLPILINLKFKEEFIKRYISANHRWPDLNVQELPIDNVIRVAYERKSIFPYINSDYQRSDLNLISFNQTFPVDPKFDIAELIADKVLSLNLPDLIYQLKHYGHSGRSKERSVLLQWAKTDFDPPDVFLEKIDLNGFPKDECCIGCKEKEREGKIKARLFALMTLYKRMYVVLTEALLAEHLIKYFPEITMTDDEVNLDKKRFSFGKKIKNYLTRYTSLDFTKWNSYMREGESKPLFQSIDQLFGFSNCFARTHEMFSSSYIYLLNEGYIPSYDINNKIKIQLGTWIGHLGGMEGQRQKGWTLWTLMIILIASEGLPLKLHILGQGDNQMIKEMIPLHLEEKGINETHFKFLNNVNNILKFIGPPLKIEETWSSDDLIVYGKYIIYKSICYGTSLKKIARLFFLSNEDYPTIDSSISSITANISGAISYSNTPDVFYFQYIMSVIEVIQAALRNNYIHNISLLYRLKYSTSFGVPTLKGRDDIPIRWEFGHSTNGLLPDIFYKRIILTPKCLGGFSIQLLCQFLIRSFPDELSLCISYLRILYIYSNSIFKRIIQDILSPSHNTTQNFCLILENPTVLNLQSPTSPADSRRDMILRFLVSERFPKNKYLASFLEIAISDEAKKLADYLKDVNHFNPRVLSILYQSTATARGAHVSGRLERTRTIARLCEAEGHMDLETRIANAELNHFLSVIHASSPLRIRKKNWNSSICSSDWSADLRKESWGITIEGVSCSSPFELFIIEKVNNNSIECNILSTDTSKGFINVRISNLPDPEIYKTDDIHGPIFPYRGTKTIQKVKGYGDHLSKILDHYLSHTLRAMTMIGWTFPRNGNMANLCVKSLTSKTDLDPNLLYIPDEEITGSYHHRVNDERTGHGGLVSVLPNYGSTISFNTSTFTYSYKGGRNITLQFQSIMIMSLVLIGWEMKLIGPPNSLVYHIYLLKTCCIKPVDDSFIEHPNAPPDDLFITDKTSPYLFVPCRTIEPLMKTKEQFTPYLNQPDDDESLNLRLDNAVAEECFKLLEIHNWHNINTYYLKHLITINWVINIDLIRMFEFLAIRILTHFGSNISKIRIDLFLRRVASSIDLSPIDPWERLSNLIFTNNFQHQFTNNVYKCTLSGNPTLTPRVMAYNLKSLIINILLLWASDPIITRKRLIYPLYSRINCGFIQHPAHLNIWRKFIVNSNIKNMYDICSRVLKFLGLEINREVPLDLERSIEKWINVHKNKVTAESTDQIAKKVLNRIISIDYNILDLRNRELLFFSLIKEKPPYSSSLIKIKSIECLDSSKLIFNQNIPYLKTNYQMHQEKLSSHISVSGFKLTSIFPFIPEIKDDLIITAAEGSGSFALTFAQSSPNCKIFYNTLIEYGFGIEQMSDCPYIPAFAGRPDLERQIYRLDITSNLVSDIMSEQFINILKSMSDQKITGITIDKELIIDIEDDTESTFLHYLRIVKTIKVDWAIIKVLGKLFPILIKGISILLSYFSEINVLRSGFSSYGNSELYLMCTGGQQGYFKFISDEKLRIIPEQYQNLLFHSITNLKDLNQFHNENTKNLILSFYENTLPSSIENISLIHLFTIGLLKYKMIFPTSLEKYIQDNCTRVPGKMLQNRKILESIRLSHKMIGRLTINWIVLWYLTLSNPEDELIESIINNGLFIWYKIHNKNPKELNWFYTIYPNSNINLSNFYNTIIYKLKDIMDSSHIKIIYKIIGLARIYGINAHHIHKGSDKIFVSLIQPPITEENLQYVPKNTNLLKLFLNPELELNLIETSNPIPTLLQQKERVKNLSIKKTQSYLPSYLK